MIKAKAVGSSTRRRSVRGPGILVAALAIVASACAPGASVAPSATTVSSAPSSSSAPSTSSAPSASAVAAGPSCGTAPVVLNGYFETGFDLPFKLSAEFTKQFPNVTWNISQDQFANLMSSTPRLLPT